ncbi:MAG: leucine-rich repeat protein [Clostridia bacterium]|nr:leucine-rich repeat protein [Clostridia bacterium]
MKKLRFILGILLVLFCFWCNPWTVEAAAKENVPYDKNGVAFEYRASLAKSASAPTNGFESLEDGGAYLREQLVARETFVSLRMRGSFASDCYTQLFEIATRHTGNPKEGDYILANLIKCTFSSVSGTDEDGAYTDVTFAIEWLPGARQEVQVDAAVSEILNELNLWDASDYDKIKGIYDWITENITYDYDWDDTTSEDLYKHSTHAAVMTKTAVCQGIASLYYRLSLELGVDCRYISGVAGQTEPENHAWNIVCLEGKYYHMDPTWDLGMINVYRYFLVSGQDFPHHYRSEKFDTAAFHALYPMAELPYVQNVTASGTIGSKIQWVLDGDTGTLTVNGSGAIPSYRYTDAPWKAYRDSVTAIVVGEGITEVGERAFYWCKNCTQVTLPDSLVAIRQYGFNNLRSLQAITLPKHLRIIESCGFSECTALKSIVLPDSVTTVGSSAFSNCSALTSATLSAGMTSVPNSIFFGDRNLRTVVLPESITSIQDTAFMNSGIRQITLPAKVTSLGTACFAGCTSLQNIYVEAGNPAYKSVNGVLYTADGTHLICYPAARYGSYVIPEGTVYVDYDAFRESDVTAVTFPSTLTKIDAYAFSWCPFLKSVTFPQNITYIGDSAFRNCTALTGVTFQNESVFLEGYTFAGCKALKSVVLPSKLTSIPNGLFDDCIQLASIDIPSTVGSIGSAAFFNCDKLVSVTIPGNVRSIGQQAFDYCQNLTVITMKEGVRTLDWIAVRNAPNLTKVVIPASVTSIDKENFENCPKAVLYVTCGTAGRSYAVNNGLNYVSTHAYTSTVTPPTCTAQGYTTHTCTVCGDSYVDTYVPATRKHTYENGICSGCGAAVPPLKGRTLSILGASISTFAGTSNGVAADTTNSTIRNNAIYYPSAVVSDVTLTDTWWMQACNDLGLQLLVNNSWSGSSLLHTRNGTVGAYVDRCLQLHDDTGENAGEEPDIIAIQMGTNDFQYYKDTLGTANIDYASLITQNGDGTFAYGVPATSLEAAAIVLHKISVRYPNAEVYYLNISQRVDGTDALIQSFNAELKKVVEHFGAHIVDIYGSAITMESFATYIGDGRVHPNKLGMDAYTEAFKAALLANTVYTAQTHKVSMDLSGVTADYGDDKLVIDGDRYVVNLTTAADMGLKVTVTMGGKDITHTAYADGTVVIDAVTADVTITAKSVYTPKNYRWVFDGSDLVCIRGENGLTKNAGTTVDGVFSNTRYALENAVVLLHNLPWVVEWQSEGSFQNSGSSSGARIFTSTDVNASYDARYIFKSNTNGIIAMGEKTSSGSHNYGIALGDHGIDWTELHTYRLENRIASDGSNRIYLFVDGNEIGAMTHYYIGTKDQSTTSDWLSGKDFVFPYMGTDTHGFTNASIAYIAVMEGGCTHSYTSVVTPPTCTAQGYTTHTCAVCGESYTDAFVPATGHTPGAAATCTEAQYCTVCTAELAPALGHALTQHGAKPATCTGIGWNAYETCSRCDHSTYKELPALGHALTQHAAKPATCTDIGWNAYETCSRCDHSTYKELPALGHALTQHTAKPATCTGIGWNAYETCSRCDYSTYSEIPALGHALTQHTAKPATCTGIGWNAYETCSRCDHSTYSEIPALGHDLTNHGAKPATCTGIGWDAYETCSRCDHSTYNEIPATGHRYTHTVVPPTTDAEGYTLHTCRSCGSSYKDNYVDRLPSSVLGDVMGDTEVDSDDAIYLLKHTLFPEMYPINQTSDFDGNGTLNSDDAIYLLKYTLFPDLYPLHGGGRSVYAMPVRTRSKDGEITE